MFIYGLFFHEFLLNVMWIKELPFLCFNNFFFFFNDARRHLKYWQIKSQSYLKDSLPGEVLTVIRLIGFNLQLHSAHRAVNVFIYQRENKSSCDARNVSSYHSSISLTWNWPCLDVTGLVEKCKPVMSTMTSPFYERISDHLVLTATHLLVKSGGKRIDGYSNCVLVAFML